jgi:hypothetical protein
MTPLEQKMMQAAELREEIAQLQPAVDRHKECEDNLKLLKMQILADLDATNSRGTDYIAGIRATKTSRTNFVIRSQTALLEWLENNIEDTSPYIRADAKAVGELAKQVKDKTGKPPAGGEFETKYSVRIEEEKVSTNGLFED